MTANELRIGNLVDLGNRIAKVIEIGHLACVVVDLEETQDTLEDYERTKPLPLTEEWFLKFGFKKVGTNFELDFFVLWYSSYQNCFVWRFMNIDSNADRPISLEYVHQLQNLYFALVGEELNFKL